MSGPKPEQTTESPFSADTYVCLDLPDPIASRILEIRRNQRDDFRAALPAEITVAGSGGVGPILADQPADAVFEALEAIAKATPPISAQFGEVMRFKGTDVFAFSLLDPSRFRVLHEQLARSGIRFREVPFRYTPHCTLRSRSPVSEQEAADLLDLQVNDPFVLGTLSVYSLDQLPMTLRFRAELRG